MAQATTKVIFNLSTKVKRAAQKRAEAEGMTLSAVLQHSALAYSTGDISIRATEVLRPAVRKSIDKALKDFEQGKNCSPRFDNIEDAQAWLKKAIGHA